MTETKPEKSVRQIFIYAKQPNGMYARSTVSFTGKRKAMASLEDEAKNGEYDICHRLSTVAVGVETKTVASIEEIMP